MNRSPARAGLRVVPALLVVLAGVMCWCLPGSQAGFVATQTLSGGQATSAYYFTCQSAVLGDGTATKATFAWPLNESSGIIANDSSGNGFPGIYSNPAAMGVSRTTCPRDTGNAAVTLNGTSSYIYSNAAVTLPTNFTEEVWFKTTNTTGRLLGFGDSRTGTSQKQDRMLFFNDSGQLCFGVYNTNPPNGYNSRSTVCDATSVSDGTWHYAVATLSSTVGMTLYVDGVSVGSNALLSSTVTADVWFHVGCDTLSNWVSYSSSNYCFGGTVSWVAFYSYAMTAAQIAAHYRAGQPS